MRCSNCPVAEPHPSSAPGGPFAPSGSSDTTAAKHVPASMLAQGSNPKTTLYVGGLDETVNEAVLHSAFIPFGEIKEVNIPIVRNACMPA